MRDAGRWILVALLVAASVPSNAHARDGSAHGDTWQPASGFAQVPIWPGAIPDALPHPKPESVGPPPGREWWLYAEGGHAFGLRPSKFPIANWPRLVETWLVTVGALP